MLQNLPKFVDPEKERDVTLFLPAAIFGYIYSEYSAVPPCPWVADNIGTLDAPVPVFMGLAVFSAALAAVLYSIPEKTFAAAKSKGGAAVAVAWIVHSLLLGISFLELAVRVCSQDIILVGIFLLYVVLGVSTAVDRRF
ncbi:hypothetical protein [Natrinema gelatinilyticum]|uniref:hypothetical protein n=1 Tax=Natrinema gelatinilyticum TaxID=2961571 RepID=UPI0020C1BEDA|nr:hypothetical protein [Natrinema gelatinilyticum]